jgi:hypothetical protein
VGSKSRESRRERRFASRMCVSRPGWYEPNSHLPQPQPMPLHSRARLRAGGDADGHGAEATGFRGSGAETGFRRRNSMAHIRDFSPRRGSNARPPMTRQPSRDATAALALQAATAEQLEHAKVELQRRQSSLAVTSHLADIMAGELSEEAVAHSAGDGPAAAAAVTAAAATRRGSQLARKPSSQLAAALHEVASEKSKASRRVSIQMRASMRSSLDASDAEVCCTGSHLSRTQDNTHPPTLLTPPLPIHPPYRSPRNPTHTTALAARPQPRPTPHPPPPEAPN